MADGDPLSEMFNLFAAPLASTVRSFDQFRKGVDEFLKGVENFNRTMENLNETTERINALIEDFEEPLRAAIPQVTRTVKAADEMMQVVSGPAIAVAPGLTKLADTLGSPAFAQLPDQIGKFTDLLGDLSNRVAPLTQLAESAGGLFGGLRIPGISSSKPDPTPPPPAPVAKDKPAKTPAARKKPATKSASTKRVPAKKAPAKKRAAKKKPAAKK